MKALLKCYNPLSIALVSTPVIEVFHEAYPNITEWHIGTFDDHNDLLYERIGVPVKVIRGPRNSIEESGYFFVFDFDAERALDLAAINPISASLAFAVMAGVKIRNLTPVYKFPEDIKETKLSDKPCIILTPYLEAYTQHDGWPSDCWDELRDRILSEFPQVDLKILAPEFRLLSCDGTGVDFEDLDLDTAFSRLRQALLVISAENGYAHLAAAAQSRILTLYPSILPEEWMSEKANPRSRIVYTDLSKLTVDFMWSVVKPEISEVLQFQESTATERF